MERRLLLPVVKTRNKETYIDNSCDVSAIVIRIRDFLFKDGSLNCALIKEIQDAGGLHQYYNFKGPIIFSSIMRDEILDSCVVETYIFLINQLKPEYYLTPDSYTYRGYKIDSRSKIEKILEMTKIILKECPASEPIGLIKGCNLSQIDLHLDKLIELKIKRFCFHAGDFIYKESEYSKSQAIFFAKSMKEKRIYLIIYGVGSNTYFRKFHFADAFVTNSHFMQAANHRRIPGSKWITFKGKPNQETIMENLRYLLRLVNPPKDLSLLSTWLSTEVIENIDSLSIGYYPVINREIKIKEV
ncbi:hypothetical protein [Methanoregula sp. UBA64]|jgi:hypothetical protein|uniref:hypothetical protein n=1 Tax=Methanoregula sp. UBA64 TaxID=1915554 RepID=UPI0025F6C27A|nr:hypothetical protein [Methanoregula sp. UBA64]